MLQRAQEVLSKGDHGKSYKDEKNNHSNLHKINLRNNQLKGNIILGNYGVSSAATRIVHCVSFTILFRSGPLINEEKHLFSGEKEIKENVEVEKATIKQLNVRYFSFCP